MNEQDTLQEVREFKKFKNKIGLYAVIVAGICQVISFLVLGVDLKFTYGLVLGTAVALLNFNILEVTLRVAMSGGSGAAIIIIGYLVRLAFYGISFYICITTTYSCGAGAALGYLTVKVAIYYLHGFKAKFSTGRVVREEPEGLKFKEHWYDYKEDEEVDPWEKDDWDYKNHRRKEE
ncbi:MAG: ATP synthase subunit I [Anaerovorax sp.]